MSSARAIRLDFLYGYLRVIMIPAILLVAMSPSSVCSGEGTTVPGLDSLASAALHQALECLEISPWELGFHKLYAEDDTFRMAIVEDLLGDPLKLPGWQDETVRKVRAAIETPTDLLALLGEMSDSPDLTPVRSGGWPRRYQAPRVSGASRHSHAMERHFADFVREAEIAESALDAAFAGLNREQIQHLLMAAPAFWGDWESETGEAIRKGMLHMEMGAAADTSMEFTEDDLLDMAAVVDRGQLLRASRLFMEALINLTDGLARMELPAARRTIKGVTGKVTAVSRTPWGKLVVGGQGDNHYSTEALVDVAFIIEPGGDDLYQGRVASAVGGLIRPFGCVVDYGGNDVYGAEGHPFAIGGALLGVAALIDVGGDDSYRGDDGSCGAGFFGTGILYDGAGKDIFEGRNLSQGAGAVGTGILISACTMPPPDGPEILEDRAYESGQTSVPGTGAVPVRFDENDTYVSSRLSQGFASILAVGLIYDEKGNDVYRSGGRYLHRPLLPSDFQSLSQGFSIGMRPRAGGGIGMLIDEEGNDFYNGEVYSQGTSYWYSVGLLFDGGGNDSYHATQYAQGAGVHLAVGSLWDRGGDDQYVSKYGVTHGTAHDYSVGFLLDEGGNDYYVVNDGQALSIYNSVAVFIDAQGNDFYATYDGGQGKARPDRDFCGAALFLDLEGRDHYYPHSPGVDGGIWSQGLSGLGMDLDRDVKLPREVTPEIVLTREDSLRSVEEAFEDASLWSVGSDWEKAQRARQILIAKAAESIEYFLIEKVSTRQSLEYRAIRDVASAHPDMFAELSLPALEEVDKYGKRNIIRILGDAKSDLARPRLEEMLRDENVSEYHYGIIETLGKIGNAESGPMIRPFLTHGDERCRIRAAIAISAMGDTASINGLVDALSDQLITVRSAASLSLKKLGAASVTPLCRSLDTGASQRALRVETLGATAISLKDSSDAASVAAVSTAEKQLLAQLGEPRNESVPGARAAAVRALVALGRDEALATVEKYMEAEAHPLVIRSYEAALEPK